MPETKRLADTLWEGDARRIDAMRYRRHNNCYPSYNFSDPDPSWKPSTPADWAKRQKNLHNKIYLGMLVTVACVAVVALLSASGK